MNSNYQLRPDYKNKIEDLVTAYTDLILINRKDTYDVKQNVKKQLEKMFNFMASRNDEIFDEDIILNNKKYDVQIIGVYKLLMFGVDDHIRLKDIDPEEIFRIWSKYCDKITYLVKKNNIVDKYKYNLKYEEDAVEMQDVIAIFSYVYAVCKTFDAMNDYDSILDDTIVKCSNGKKLYKY